MLGVSAREVKDKQPVSPVVTVEHGEFREIAGCKDIFVSEAGHGPSLINIQTWYKILGHSFILSGLLESHVNGIGMASEALRLCKCLYVLMHASERFPGTVDNTGLLDEVIHREC